MTEPLKGLLLERQDLPHLMHIGQNHFCEVVCMLPYGPAYGSCNAYGERAQARTTATLQDCGCRPRAAAPNVTVAQLSAGHLPDVLPMHAQDGSQRTLALFGYTCFRGAPSRTAPQRGMLTTA